MEEDTDLVDGPPVPVHERYFTNFYHMVRGSNGTFEDQCVLKHSNRICVVCIAPAHSLLTEKAINIDFNDLVCNSVSGKKKKGGFLLNPQSVLCTVTCQDGRIFKLRSCIRGTLVEINNELVRNPSLLRDAPLRDGYIAIILPKFMEAETVCSHLLSAEEYMLRKYELVRETTDIREEKNPIDKP